jgi:hypothetical protein
LRQTGQHARAAQTFQRARLRLTLQVERDVIGLLARLPIAFAFRDDKRDKVVEGLTLIPGPSPWKGEESFSLRTPVLTLC